MAFEYDFLELMPHVVTIAPFTGVNTFGVKTHGTPVSFQARIVGKIVTLRRNDKEDITSIVDIYLDAKGAIFSTDDLVQLPADGAWIDTTPLIFAVARSTDEGGHHHVKIQCGWMYHRQGQ